MSDRLSKSQFDEELVSDMQQVNATGTGRPNMDYFHREEVPVATQEVAKEVTRTLADQFVRSY